MPRPPYNLIKPNAVPYASKPYSVPKKHEDVTRNEIERLLKIGVKRTDYSSPWAAPCFILPKKNGQARFMIDYRQLIRYPFPLPKIADILHGIQKFQYVLNLNRNIGYYSTKIDKDSQHLLAFVLPWGKHTFQRMPFGISTATDEFKARMSNLFADLLFEKCYLDNIAMMTDGTLEDDIDQLNLVLQRLNLAGLQINATKSNFAVTETEYLDDIISCQGIQPHPKKLQAIRDIASPRTKRELRRFIGLVNYYRDTLPRRLHALAPLTAMTSKTTKFNWTSTTAEAFMEAKRAISSIVTLRYPDYEQAFKIYTGASSFQLRGG